MLDALRARGVARRQGEHMLKQLGGLRAGGHPAGPVAHPARPVAGGKRWAYLVGSLLSLDGGGSVAGASSARRSRS